MILEGPNIQDQCEATTPAALSIAQLLSIKHQRKQATTTVRNQETPVPTYIGLMLHGHTHKRELVDRFHHLGMSISYDRVLRLSAQMGSEVCKQFHREHVVCPPKLRYGVLTSAAVENIDHNPTSTTSKDAFHGTAISLIQHPTSNDEGMDSIAGGSMDISSKSVDHLPHFFTDVSPITSSKKSVVPATSVTSLERDNFKQQTEKEYLWLEQTRRVKLGV